MTSSDIDGRSGFLVRGPAGAYRALGAFGRPAYESFAQLQSTLRGKASPACLAYFARPTFDVEQKEFRWTAPAAGAIRPWRDLNDAERQAGEAVLVQVGAELAGLREQFRQRGGQSAAYATLLDEAVKVPPQDGDDWHYLYLVGDQPVAAFWGFETHDGRWFDPTAPRSKRSATTVPLGSTAVSEVPPAPAPHALPTLPHAAMAPAALAPDSRQQDPIELANRIRQTSVVALPTRTPSPDTVLVRQRPWWAFWGEGAWGRVLGGVLGLLLLAALLLVLLRGCYTTPVVAPVIGTPTHPLSATQSPVAMPVAPAAPQQAALPPATEATTTPPLTAVPNAPEAPNVPKTGPSLTSPPLGPAPEGVASATVPPNTDATGLLHGQWRAGEDLFDQNTGQPLDLTFAFGADGTGKVTMRRPDGSTCTGAVASRANGPRMTIEGASIPCAGGGSYAPPRVECTRSAEGPLLCFGINPDGSRYRMAMRPTN